jgi:hypothetical protein
MPRAGRPASPAYLPAPGELWIRKTSKLEPTDHDEIKHAFLEAETWW